jgi:hypothetical protein
MRWTSVRPICAAARGGHRLRRSRRARGDDQAGQHDLHRHTEQAQATFRSELTKYAALVKKAGIEPQ